MDNQDIIFLGITLLTIALLAIKIYGVVLGFKSKWYFGVLALVVPFFAEIITISKLLLKKDLLECKTCKMDNSKK